MKPRDEDSLISLAFGELSEEESETLRASLRDGSEAAETFAGYRQLKKDLMLLNDIPEPQISTERIRGAILGRGLKQKTDIGRWGWILGPALACVLVVGFTLNRVSPAQSQPPVTDNTPSVAFLQPFTPAVGDPLQDPLAMMDPGHAARSDYSFGSDDAVKPVPVLRRHSHSSRSGFRRHSPSQLSDSLILSQGTVFAGLEGFSGNSGSSLSASATVTAQVPAKPSGALAASKTGDQKIIVVNDAQDNATGAQQATEVDSSANVIVGG